MASQVALHAATGGIVPEVAARQQLRWIVPTLEAALDEAEADWADLDAVAVTYGPGLIGSLLVGVNFAKALAVAHDLPLVGVNHIEGHIYANWLTDALAGRPAPARARRSRSLCLVVSGGHTQLVLMHDHGRYTLLGQTVDDAAGEAFDKVGRLLELPYPGGPAISAAAEGAAPATRFPRAQTDGAYDFSFSGLKTAVLREVAGYRERGEAIPVDGHRRRVRGGRRRRAGDEDGRRGARSWRRRGRARRRRGRQPRAARRRSAERLVGRRAAAARAAAGVVHGQRGDDRRRRRRSGSRRATVPTPTWRRSRTSRCRGSCRRDATRSRRSACSRRPPGSCGG